MAYNSTEKTELMDQVKQQNAVAEAQEFVSLMTNKCFKKCVNKPGTSLDASEQKCICLCMDRFMDSWNLIAHTLVRRVQEKEKF